MNKTQKVQHTSHKLIVKEATNAPDNLELVPSFKRGITRLGEINNEVDSFGVQQEKELSGITINKNNITDNLIDWLIMVSGAEHSYAHRIGNIELMSRVDYKKSALKHLDKPELLSVAGVVLEEGQRIPAEALSEEGISPDDLIFFQNLIATYNVVQLSPQEAAMEQSGATEKLRTLFAEARGIIKNSLDKLAPQYKIKAPEYYRLYKTARGINSRGKKSTKTEPVVTPEPPVVR